MTDSLIVLDASAAVKAVLPNPLQAHCLAWCRPLPKCNRLRRRCGHYETTSAIAKAVHFGEITENEARQSLEKLDTLGVRLFVPDADQNRAAFDWTLKLKRASAYDSYYLVLAQALECDFWTADKRLFNALKDAHLGWLHWIEEADAVSCPFFISKTAGRRLAEVIGFFYTGLTRRPSGWRCAGTGRSGRPGRWRSRSARRRSGRPGWCRTPPSPAPSRSCGRRGKVQALNSFLNMVSSKCRTRT